MKIRSRTTAGIAVGLTLVVGLAVAPAGAAPPPTTSVPSAAAWLADQVGADGSVESFGAPDASATRNVAMSLAAARSEDTAFERALGWLEANAEAVISPGDDPDSPGALGDLLLLTAAAGEDPTGFGGIDLVSRLGATLGLDETGLYGAGDPTYDGVYRQGLAILGLEAHGVVAPQAAVDWLVTQQCDNTTPGAGGGWTAYRADVSEACPAPDSNLFTGPDTNSTALAVQALSANGTMPTEDPISFLEAAQGDDGGFPFVSGGVVDPNSTALVIQALLAAGEDIHAPDWATDDGDPMTSLVAWQLTTGADAGALASPFSGGAADLYATRQAIWGLAEAPFPLQATPGRPLRVLGTSRSTSLTLQWEAPTYTGGSPITGYVIVDAGSSENIELPANARSYERTGLEYWSVYSPAVYAVNARGDGIEAHFGDLILGFWDVDRNHPFLHDIAWGSDEGIFGGFADRTFRPTTSVSRQAMAAFLYRLAGSPDGPNPTCATPPFIDVPITNGFCGEVAWLEAEGLTTGYPDGTFRPTAPISRLAMGVQLYRAAESPDGLDPACTLAPFTDVAMSDASCGELAWMKTSGISEGYADGTYRPASLVTRQAMAAFLHRSAAT